MSFPHITLKSAKTRLTLTYLGIIMVLTIGFSAAFYYQSIIAADAGLSKQIAQLQENLFFTTDAGLDRIHNAELKRFQNDLLAKLVFFNIGMLVVGGGASYILAGRSLRPLEEALRTQSRFTSDAAHELRTPLTAMKIEAEVALRDKQLKTAEARSVIKSNLEEISKLELLTAALLRLARSSEHIDKSYWQSYHLADIFQTAYERLEDKAKKRTIKFQFPKSRLTVWGDPDQLVELFVTLFGNAIKYSHEGGKVKIVANQHDKFVRIDVVDKGIGISEIDLPHVFERFYRADQSRTHSSAEGYGLGLSLAEAIAVNHGGSISVNSTYGKGSTFSVYLPK